MKSFVLCLISLALCSCVHLQGGNESRDVAKLAIGIPGDRERSSSMDLRIISINEDASQASALLDEVRKAEWRQQRASTWDKTLYFVWVDNAGRPIKAISFLDDSFLPEECKKVGNNYSIQIIQGSKKGKASRGVASKGLRGAAAIALERLAKMDAGQ